MTLEVSAVPCEDTDVRCAVGTLEGHVDCGRHAKWLIWHDGGPDVAACTVHTAAVMTGLLR